MKSVSALILCRSDCGCGSLVASSVCDLSVTSFEVFCALVVGCSTSSGVIRRPSLGLPGSGREVDMKFDASRGGDVARFCFGAG